MPALHGTAGPGEVGHAEVQCLQCRASPASGPAVSESDLGPASIELLRQLEMLTAGLWCLGQPALLGTNHPCRVDENKARSGLWDRRRLALLREWVKVAVNENKMKTTSLLSW